MPTAKRETTRCFALLGPDERQTVGCRFKPRGKKTGPQISIDKAKTSGRAVTHAGSVVISADVTVEIWQTDLYTHETPIEKVWDIPLLSTILVYPVIIRVVATDPNALPTVGRTRRLLADQMAQSMRDQFAPLVEEEEEVDEESSEPTIDDDDEYEDDLEEDDDAVEVDEGDDDDDVDADDDNDDVDADADEVEEDEEEDEIFDYEAEESSGPTLRERY